MTLERTRRLLWLGLTLTPLAQAVAAQLCPVDPWACERTESGWRCAGLPSALPSASIDAAARAAASTDLKAATLEGTDGELIRLDGGAQALRADQQLRADSIEYDIAKDTALAKGSVRYEDAINAFYAVQASADMAKDETTLSDVRYALKARRGQGRATEVVTRGDGTTDLSDVTYTACPGDDPSWQIEASQLHIDHDAGQASAENFKLRVGGIPVFYAPYASFPIDDRRKSGFLPPRIGGGSDGFDIAVPWYWNIAPNYDATLTPRIISDRGFQADGEFRYLYRGGNGQVDAEFLPDDDLLGSNRERYRVRHNGSLLPGVRLDADLNHVSDDRYFVDLGDSLNTSSTSVLGSALALSGGGRDWRWSVLADQYELILPDVAEALQQDPYQRMPRAAIDFNQRQGNWRYGVAAEWVNFQADGFCSALDSTGGCTPFQRVEGSRLDLTPYVGYALEPSWGHLRTRAALRHTRYQLDRGTLELAESSPTRTTPIFSVDGGLEFERGQPFGKSGWRQTLEPRLYYLHVPERDQSAIPVFDTAPLDFSYAQLFRDNRYSGADRQADANQLTLAVTSRILDDATGAERAALSLGQIYYFDAPQVYLPSESDPYLVDQRQRSAYVAEGRAALSDSWSLIGGFRYDPERERTDFGALRVQKRFGSDGLLNLGYRYRPDGLLYTGAAPASAFSTKAGIEQAELSALIPVNDHWRAVFRWNYSLRESTTLEAVAGFEYISCCYSVRLLSRNYLRGIGTERRNAIFLEFELTGLGSFGRDTGDFLRRAILGYQPFGGTSE